MINRDLIRLKVVQLIYAFYQNEGKDYSLAEKELVHSMDKAYELYHYLLSLLVDIRQMAERKEEARLARCRRLGSKEEGVYAEKQLAENRFLLQLERNKQLCEYAEKRSKDHFDEESFLKKLYTSFVDSEVFQLYLAKEDFSYDSDRELIRKLYKTYVCNNEDFDALLEDRDLYWNDDKEIIDSFVLKTIKRFKSEEGDEQPLLPQFSEEEDREFALKLFKSTIDMADEVRTLIKNNCKNWEFERLAFMDVVIMQIAMAEILSFPSIPLKVSINEYLDIAKVYSTPRSSSYINGVIDHIVKKLQKENQLMKA